MMKESLRKNHTQSTFQKVVLRKSSASCHMKVCMQVESSRFQVNSC